METAVEAKTKNAVKQLEQHNVVTQMREKAMAACARFKISWVELGQILHAIREDKLYHVWGFEKFEDYTKKELGFDKNVAIKLLKSYLYLIEDASEYLREDFTQSRETDEIPSIDEINFLRLAKGKKDLLAKDQEYFKKQVFEKGKVAEELKKDLVALMKERKVVDVVAEQDKRKTNLIKSLMMSLTKFHAEMQTSKLVPYDIIQDAEELLNRLKEEAARA